MFSCFCFRLQDNSFNSTAAAEDENNKENFPQRANILDESQPTLWDTQQQVEKKVFDSISRPGISISQIKTPKSNTELENGKSHERSQAKENVVPGFSDQWVKVGVPSNEHPEHAAIKSQDTIQIQPRKGHGTFVVPKEAAEQLQSFAEEEDNREPDSKETATLATQSAQADLVVSGDPALAQKDWQSNTDNEPHDHHSLETSRLLYHITDGDNPLLSPRCSIFSQSQRFNLDPESAPSPPSTQQFMMPRSSSRGKCVDIKEPQTVAQLTKHIQNLKRKIRKYEEKFELEKKYRPSHSDKISNPEVLKWMTDLAKDRKQLKELKLKMSEDRNNVLRTSQCNLPGESSGIYNSRTEQQGAATSQLPSVEETVDTVWKRLKEKRQLLNLPENLETMTHKQMTVEKNMLQKWLLYFESIHGQPANKEEQSLMKPLYDRYRIIKQLLSASLIPTIEEEDSDEDSSQGCHQLSCQMASDSTVDEHLSQSDQDNEPTVLSPLEEKKAVKQPALSLSNLHEATMSELLEHLRETKADKKRLRKALREYEEHFLKQTGRNAKKEDRIPMAEEYCEYKQIKAKLRLLEVLINKQGVSKTI
ncbi:protein FAM13C [Microcaecilia unicolor]|uniref:Protein FAM13C n=1 Tax=Microcaecilia unicolor TaxID=1415580 RepID=A0A6P7YCC0_9AMPH|nr:protein FAM13C [Microcaecilia unicolor]